ncbi:hypothetical protein JTE90_017266 [Oedothorax gibbosus]|uniref:Uncharacterized protein n=1 Tax=Oedothorax gibbosus TaxID=931172 RepID=A0AAV6VE69_9ARAC|nr:hypothetical protein JTE90_017266 [Oedothorax gibbosus]
MEIVSRLEQDAEYYLNVIYCAVCRLEHSKSSVVIKMGLTYLACVLLVVFSPSFAKPDCESTLLENCLSSSLFEIILTTLRGSLNEMVLNNSCSGIIEDVSCKAEYLGACTTASQAQDFLLFNKLTSLFEDMCNDTSELRKGFRQHVACLTKNAEGIRQCWVFASEQPHYQMQVDRLTKFNPLKHANLLVYLRAIQSCTFEQHLQSCAVDFTTRSCGKEAATFLQTTYANVIQDWKSFMCEYKDEVLFMTAPK